MNVWDTLDEFAAAAELPAPVSKQSSSSSLRSVPPSPHHPLKSRPNSVLVDTAPAPEASTSSLTSAPAAISADLRSRRTTANGTVHAPVDADVTRPSLKRLTDKDKHSSATVQARAQSGGAAKSRTSLDELVRDEAGLAEGEREVVVHELVKTDTIASISLQYGITPQALRLSNRLWPSDSIHLRRVLNVPLDQCNLPSSSSIQGLSRDKDGSLVVWERERPSTQPPTQTSILAPSARRATSEMGALSSGPGSYVDLLGLDSARSSMDDFREHAEPKGKDQGKAAAPPVLLIDADDAVAGYLATTNNTFSFSAPPSPPILSSRSSPVDFFGRVTPPPPHFDPPDPPSRASSSSSSSSNPFANPPPVPSIPGRKLTVSRVPVSSLSYFPPPNPSFSSNRSSVSDASDSSDLGLSTHPSRRSIASGMHDIGPLTNSLSHLSIPAPHTTRNPYDPKATIKKKASWTKRWDLSYFGAEGEGDVVEFQQAEDWRLSRGAVNGARGGGAAGANGR